MAASHVPRLARALALMLHHLPSSVDEADDMLDVVMEVRADARANHNRALVVDCDDQMLELLALRIAMIPAPRQP